jgi:predicted transcriptional regulator
MQRYAQTQDEIAGLLGLSAKQFRHYAKRDDAPPKLKSGYNVAQWQEYYKEQKEGALKGDGSLRDEKTLREIQRLDIIIRKEAGDLVDRSEEERRFRDEWDQVRKAIEDWRAHESAKHPGTAEIIDALADRLILRIGEV